MNTLAKIVFAALMLVLMLASARSDEWDRQNTARAFYAHSETGVARLSRRPPHRRRGHYASPRRAAPVLDANGNGVVRSRSGVAVRVSPAARVALQCVVNYVEGAGVRIKAMRGYGYGTVAHSLHPSGRALDINQTDRNVTRPYVPRSVSNAAADKCGVISGARWGYADNGHWNLHVHGRPSQPWPRVVNLKHQGAVQ